MMVTPWKVAEILRRFITPIATCPECGAFVEPELKEIHRAWHASLGVIRAPGSMLHTHGEPRQ